MEALATALKERLQSATTASTSGAEATAAERKVRSGGADLGSLAIPDLCRRLEGLLKDDDDCIIYCRESGGRAPRSRVLTLRMEFVTTPRHVVSFRNTGVRALCELAAAADAPAADVAACLRAVHAAALNDKTADEVVSDRQFLAAGKPNRHGWVF